MATILIDGSETQIEAAVGTNLLRALIGATHPISTSCGGRATCGLCRLTVVEGADLLSPIVPGEITHLGNVAKVVGLRLACQATVVGEGTIRIQVPEAVDVKARKRDKARRTSHPRTSDGSHAGSGEHLEPIEWRPRLLDSTKRKEEEGSGQR